MNTPGRPVLVVTGAASGIGRALVAALPRQGWFVVGTDRPGSGVSELGGSGNADVVGVEVT